MDAPVWVYGWSLVRVHECTGTPCGNRYLYRYGWCRHPFRSACWHAAAIPVLVPEHGTENSSRALWCWFQLSTYTNIVLYTVPVRVPGTGVRHGTSLVPGPWNEHLVDLRPLARCQLTVRYQCNWCWSPLHTVRLQRVRGVGISGHFAPGPSGKGVPSRHLFVHRGQITTQARALVFGFRLTCEFTRVLARHRLVLLACPSEPQSLSTCT